jgi:predicted Zn-dependent protease
MRHLLFVIALIISPAALAGPGEKAYNEFKANDGLYDDPQWQEYVQALGERLVGYSDKPNKTFYFYVIDSPAVNAMAYPDGYIFVYRGLLAYLESEDQLASVIGHEIAHVTEGHAKSRIGLSALGNVAGFVAAVLTGVGDLQSVASGYTAEAVSGYGREQELEADRVGGAMMAKAGYNPYAVIEMIQVLKDHETFSRQVSGAPQTYHGLFASHPKNDKRLHDAVEGAYQYVPPTLVEPVGDMWQLLDGLVYGNEAADGVVKGSSYYNSQLRVVVSFPDQWKVSASQSKVMGRAPAGGANAEYVTVQRQDAVAEQTPKQYVVETLKRDDLVEGGEEVEINGMPAYIGALDTEGRKVAASRIAVVYRSNAAYLFKGEAGEDVDAEAFAAKFRARPTSRLPTISASPLWWVIRVTPMNHLRRIVR